MILDIKMMSITLFKPSKIYIERENAIKWKFMTGRPNGFLVVVLIVVDDNQSDALVSNLDDPSLLLPMKFFPVIRNKRAWIYIYFLFCCCWSLNVIYLSTLKKNSAIREHV